MKKLISLLLTVSIVFLLSSTYSEATVPLRYEILLYRLLTRAPHFGVALEEPFLMSFNKGNNTIFYKMSGFLILCNPDDMLVHSANITVQPDSEKGLVRTALLVNCLEMDDAQYARMTTDEAFKDAIELIKSAISTSLRGNTFTSEKGYEYLLTNITDYSISVMVNNMN